MASSARQLARPSDSDSESESETLELGFWAKLDGSDFEWQKCQPGHGSELYVRALQLLGLDMAQAVPGKVCREAIVALGQDPTGDLIVGNFKKTAKERTLNLERKTAPTHLSF